MKPSVPDGQEMIVFDGFVVVVCVLVVGCVVVVRPVEVVGGLSVIVEGVVSVSAVGTSVGTTPVAWPRLYTPRRPFSSSVAANATMPPAASATSSGAASASQSQDGRVARPDDRAREPRRSEAEPAPSSTPERVVRRPHRGQ